MGATAQGFLAPFFVDQKLKSQQFRKLAISLLIAMVEATFSLFSQNLSLQNFHYLSNQGLGRLDY